MSDPLVAAFLADRDVPCPRCGYNLRDLDSARCPECGLVLRLPLVPRPARGAAWWLGLGGIAGTAAALTTALAASVARKDWVLVVISALGLCSTFAPARRWTRTPRAFAQLLRHKKQERVAAWWLAFLFSATLAAVAATYSQ